MNSQFNMNQTHNLLCSVCLNFFTLPENFSIYSNKFFHNFHLSESSINCPSFRQVG